MYGWRPCACSHATARSSHAGIDEIEAQRDATRVVPHSPRVRGRQNHRRRVRVFVDDPRNRHIPALGRADLEHAALPGRHDAVAAGSHDDGGDDDRGRASALAPAGQHDRRGHEHGGPRRQQKAKVPPGVVRLVHQIHTARARRDQTEEQRCAQPRRPRPDPGDRHEQCRDAKKRERRRLDQPAAVPRRCCRESARARTTRPPCRSPTRPRRRTTAC